MALLGNGLGLGITSKIAPENVILSIEHVLLLGEGEQTPIYHMRTQIVLKDLVCPELNKYGKMRIS